MKRWIIYLLIFGTVFSLPVERVDVAQLEPVGVVSIRKDEKLLVMETDTGDFGYGSDVKEALAQLHTTASGVIYLDTAQYLLVDPDVQSQIGQVERYLKPDIHLYGVEGVPELTEVGRYLENHAEGIKLKDWQVGMILPVLHCEKKRMWIG